MSACNVREPRNTVSGDWSGRSPPTTRSSSPPSRGEAIFNKYIDLIHSKSNLSTNDKQAEPPERPFDFYDDEEFAFGINLLNNNVACVGDNITKLIQMAQEPWPDNVKLFQPYEVEQILLPDNASCLAVQAFLKMCNLPFEVEMRWNAEFMSPSGRVPFIKCGAFVVSELEPIVQFAANKGVTLCARLTTEEKAEMRAYMSLITNVLVNAELYISWVDNDTFNAVTKVRNSSVYPWPLGWLQTRAKRNAVIKRLKALHWYDKTLDQVLADVEQCCNSLSQRLGDRDYFFGATPTPLDALVYGHMRAILSATGAKVALMIKCITSSLLRHLLRCINITQMTMTAQEEYLVTQAFQLSRRRLSPERTMSERSTRIKRSRMSVRNTSKDNISYSGRDVFGFKPFASKQIIIMTSKEGAITCKYESQKKYDKNSFIDEDRYNYMYTIMEDILEKVEEIISDEYTEKLDSDTEKNDSFEIISIPVQSVQDAKFEAVEMKVNEYLDTIMENDLTDTTNSLEAHEGVIHVIHDGESFDSYEKGGKVVADDVTVKNSLDSDATDIRFSVHSQTAY
ncbi:uncharacterized protein LOC113504066 isoform X2 [Trichoplusia ni]|uniref:Uncharacterized protein LOC113504066 isoform X2 n=1 Tax=Trichoplusia ni TaxID=7111 RepID=A0A7E5WMH1_TRINI|nr:uncharacterized protein LOC113504066 isoform X2 [Trichoplusia ni]